MPKFNVPFTIAGAVPITADDARHAQEIFNTLSLYEIADRGNLESFDPDELPREDEAILADRHWDRVKEAKMEDA